MLSLLHGLQRPAIAAHLKRLSPSDRFLRFGLITQDVYIDRYVQSINFNRDAVIGVWEAARLVAMCHLSGYLEDGQPVCELSISVDASHRRHRLGARLLDEASRLACKRGLRKIHVFMMRSNRPMQALLKAAGPVSIETEDDEAIATLTTPVASTSVTLRHGTLLDGRIERLEPTEAQGPRVLCVHGAGGEAWNFGVELFDGLTRAGFAPMAVSLPDHGESEAGRLTHAQYLTVLRDVLHEVGPVEHVVAHSMGGYLAQALYNEMDLRSMVLLAPVPELGLPGDSMQLAQSGLKDEHARQVLATAMTDAPEQAPRNRGNMVFLAGNRDRVIPEGWVRANAKRLDARYRRVTGGGHNLVTRKNVPVILDALAA